jgi:hypothetical protein
MLHEVNWSGMTIRRKSHPRLAGALRLVGTRGKRLEWWRDGRAATIDVASRKVRSMQGCLLAIVGLIFGAVLGAMVGVGLGFAYTKIFNVSDFEGYSGMLVFFTFMPLGAIVGGIGGAVLLGIIGSRK